MKPTGCEPWRWRKLDDEGKLWTFDPAASFTVDMTVPAGGVAEAEFVMGRADNAVWAAELIARRLDLPAMSEPDLHRRIYETRAVEPSHALPSRWPFAFSEDGRRLNLTHRTPRPWAHVMANELGMSTMTSNDGEVFSAFANARQNGLSAFRFSSTTVQQPGQILYVRDLEAGETDSPGFAPFQREDATYAVSYEPGAAIFKKRRGDLEMETVVFVPPDRPCDVRILTLRNAGERPKSLRVVPFFDIALEESPNESVGKIRDETVGATLLYQNRLNDFERGFAFAATNLASPATETVRARFFGGPGRDIHTPAMVETGAPDESAADDGRRVAAFVGDVQLPPGGEARIVVVFGQAKSRAEALAAVGRVSVAEAEADLAATRDSWAARLGKVEVRTNRPDFDRLVNTWLPYQLYASRLWGRVGPNQRGGATGYRDQLQDVLPLALLEPRLTRAQIVLHASQQFLEGDVLKWWHRAPNGGTGLGQRTKASDPHLWLPYVLARYVRATGDASVLDEVTPFLEGEAVPDNQETWIVIPRESRETATVYEHARLAIAFTLGHLAENGLPLLRAGDWNDGIDALGRREIGSSVWMGFFLANVLDGFVPLAEAKGDDGVRRTLPGGACQAARGARGRLARRSLCARLRRQRRGSGPAERDDDRLGGLVRRLRRYARARGARGRPQGDRASRPCVAARDAFLRAFAALSGPDRRLPARRPGERRPVQPWRIVDRRRLRPPRQRRAGAGRERQGGAAFRPRLRNLREDLALAGRPSRSGSRSTASSQFSSRPTSTTAGDTAAGADGRGTPARRRACFRPPTRSSESAQTGGEVVVRDDLFEDKGGLRVEALRIGDRRWRRSGDAG